MHPIKYIGFFDFQDSKVSRNYPLACTNKMESIAEALVDAGYSVEIISTAVGTNDKFFFSKGEVINRSEKLKARFFPTFGGPNVVIRGVRRWLTSFCFLKYLLLNTKKDEPIIVYHSTGFRNLILFAKKVKKFKLILELEEVYQDVVDMTEAERQTELDTFAQADGYIFPTKLLNDKINSGKKPYAIILGTYHVEPEITGKFNDGKTHVVYAGTFDPRKGGAAAAAAFLPDNYVFHICGFGSPKEIADVKVAIDQVNKVTPGKAVYHGTLTGKTYISLIQSCHIGLSTQNPDAQFNATSFPSKILSYMSNGLEVVTVDIPAVKNSAVGKYLNYYEHQTPQEIAKAIAGVQTNHDNRMVIGRLYKDFVLSIDSLIKSFLK